MGNCISAIKRRHVPNKAITLAIIGLDNAGKTTMCYVLTGEPLDPDLAPTVGFRNVKLSRSNFDVTVFDLGGGENIRPIWKTYFGEVFGLMYVVDSSTPSRLLEARSMFNDTLEHPQVSGKPVLILANKVDKKEHMKEADIVSGLLLENTKATSKCPVKLVMVSALRGVGSKMDKQIESGLSWLFESIRSSLGSLEPRIEQDMKAAKEAREKERDERKARVKKQREEREKAEELERTRLGLTKKVDSDEDDIIIGDPFKALDLDTLKKKEQELKEEKLLKKERISKFANNNEVRKADAGLQHTADSNHKITDSNQDINMKDLSISDGLTLHLDDGDYPALTLQGRRTPASVLPPLEPIGTLYQDNLATMATKKKNRKKKRLTDYHLQSHNLPPSLDNDLNMPLKLKDDGTHVLELSSQSTNDLTINRANINQPSDQTSEIEKPKKSKNVNARRMSKYDTESAFHKNMDENHMSHVRDIDGFNYSKRQVKEEISPHLREKNDENDGKSFDAVSYGSGDSNFRKSKKKVNLSNLNELGGHEKDEGIDISDEGNLESYITKSQSRLNKIEKPRKSRKEKVEKSSVTNLPSDEDNNSYASHSSLKDTLRYPLSPTYVEDLRNSLKGRNDMHNHRDNGGDNGVIQSESFESVANGGIHGHRSSKSNGNAGSYLGNSRTLLSPSVHSSDREEEMSLKSQTSEKSDVRRKKKSNFLRSNKVTPYENLISVSEEMSASSHVVQDDGSKSVRDVSTPTKNRNTTVTSYQGNNSHDSDFNTKWGLAEDLPAVDGGFRRPNFDSNDDDDIVF